MRFSICLISTTILSATIIPARASLNFTSSDTREALHALDNSLTKRREFIDRRQAGIDSLVDSLSHNPGNQRMLLEIAQRYTAFNNDSALHYLSMGSEIATGLDRVPFELRRAALIPLSGAFGSAEHVFAGINPDSLPARLLPLYHESGRQMSSYLAAFSPNGSPQRNSYSELAREHQRELISLLPDTTSEYRYHLGEYFFETGRKGKARALLEEVFAGEPQLSNLRARAAHHLASLARERGDDDAYTYYLARAAIADVSAATREVAALQELGNHMYTRHDDTRSYNYLTEALANAVECGAPLRMVESSRSLPLIERAKAAQLQAKENTIYMIIGLMILILVGLIFTLFFLRREMHKMRLLQEHLRSANRTKEVYISQFLSLCSIYMDKLNQFCKIANRKIATGKVDDLYRLTKSGKFVEEQSKDFYEVFDNAFLHLYPNFPAQVNALLRPDAQIELKDGELLNTDLRILAFMRLGIEESTRIAQVLNYSINTIYAYRNRTKARAIDRNNFEDNIMNISGD